ncbi:MAG TPA: universal stress protein [Dehalococcoidia bacterium]|nr:universal stress protein [Dehalococcoidia bacterium]
MRRILVPLDGSPLSETAIPFAKALAAETGCELSLLSVWEVLPEELETVGATHARVLRDQGMRYFRTYLTNIAAALEDCFVSCEVRAGHPAFEIMLAAAELDADFVVMASHGRRGASERRRGSVADKVLRGSSVPVLVVGPAVLQKPPIGPVSVRSLVLPLDGSRESESAIGVAVEIARSMGAQITLLRVVPPLISGLEIGMPEAPPPEVDRHMVKSARSYLKQFRTAHPDVITSVVVERGPPAKAIVEFVSQIRPDLVVMASRSRYSTGRWALGSVADDVIEGPVPVVIVHPAAEVTEALGPAALAAPLR